MTPTLYGYLTEYAASAPMDRLLGEDGAWLTAAETRRLVDRTAAALLRLGLRPGDMAAVKTGQSVQTALWLFALSAAGAAAVLCDPREDPGTRCAGIPVKAVLADGRYTDLSSGQTAGLDPFSLPDAPLERPFEDPLAPGFVIFTSGSTGGQKAVVLSQSSLICNLLDSRPLGDYRQGDIALGAAPLSHVFGLVLLAGTVVLRYALYLLAEKGTEAVLSAIQAQGITRMNGVPSLYLAMAERQAGYDLHTLRAGFVGGAPWTPEQFRRAERALGMTLISVYGMSECVGIACASFRDPQAERAAGVGRPYPMNRVRVADEGGASLPAGTVGEICVSGPMRMIGYLDRADTNAAIDGDGFLHTGDLGFLDGVGVLHLTGRKKDIIIRNGVNLSARKIERAMLSIPGVAAAAVVGLPHEPAGELPYAMAAASVSKADILSALSGLLAKNELPADILLVDAIPLNAAGKADKQTVREVLAQWVKA